MALYMTDENGKLVKLAGNILTVSTDDGSAVQTILDGKVDKVEGKTLSSNDYTDTEKTKLTNIEEGANKTIVDEALSTTSTNPVQNKIITEQLNLKATNTSLNSTNTKVASLESGISTINGNINTINTNISSLSSSKADLTYLKTYMKKFFSLSTPSCTALFTGNVGSGTVGLSQSWRNFDMIAIFLTWDAKTNMYFAYYPTWLLKEAIAKQNSQSTEGIVIASSNAYWSIKRASSNTSWESAAENACLHSVYGINFT